MNTLSLIRMIGTGCLFLMVLLLPILIPSAGGQGMVPLSEVIDHKIEEDKQPLKKLSPEKIKAHVKIASSFTKDGEVEDMEDASSSSDKIKIKDKPLEFQNPSKHASDEFLLHFLLEQYPLSSSEEEKIEILQNLENFSHKFENGRDLFKSTQALKTILLPALNSSNPEIRRGSCAVFAIAAQNNFDVQDAAVDAGVVRNLVHLLTFDQSVRSKALFALTSLLRNFPKAQGKFVKDGGIPALVKVAGFTETRKRSLNLVSDLLAERSYCRIEQNAHGRVDDDLTLESDAEEDEDPCDEFKILETALKETGWCEVLSDSIQNIPGFESEDQIVTSEAVVASLGFCRERIAPHGKIFRTLLKKFEMDKEEDWGTEIETIKDILEGIAPVKDEL